VVEFFPAGTSVSLELDMADLPLSAKQLSNTGMIVTALVRNAMKYAFNRRDRRQLALKAHPSNGSLCIAVRDHGPGLPPTFNLGSDTGFGLTMVHALAENLNATFGSSTAPAHEQCCSSRCSKPNYRRNEFRGEA